MKARSTWSRSGGAAITNLTLEERIGADMSIRGEERDEVLTPELIDELLNLLDADLKQAVARLDETLAVPDETLAHLEDCRRRRDPPEHVIALERGAGA